MPKVGQMSLDKLDLTGNPKGDAQAKADAQACGVIGVAPFKTHRDLINTIPETGYPYKLRQAGPLGGDAFPDGIEWKSPERAYHGQKLLQALSETTQATKRQVLIAMIRVLNTRPAKNPQAGFDPREDWTPLLQSAFPDEDKFNADYVHAHRDNFMRTVLQMRFEQDPGFKKAVLYFCENGIMPIELSQHDSYWASGPKGNGENRLGIMMLEIGNAHCATLKIPDPAAAYEALRGEKPSPIHPPAWVPGLSHDQIERYDIGKKGSPLVEQERTPSPPPQYPPHVTALYGSQYRLDEMRRFNEATSFGRTQRAFEAISHSPAVQELAAKLGASQMQPGLSRGTLKVIFNSATEAEAFVTTNQDKYKLSYHGDQEKSARPGQFIVRFEREEKGDSKPCPQSAMKFFQDKDPKTVQHLKVVMRPWERSKPSANYFNHSLKQNPALDPEQKQALKDAREAVRMIGGLTQREMALRCVARYARNFGEDNARSVLEEDLKRCGVQGASFTDIMNAVSKMGPPRIVRSEEKPAAESKVEPGIEPEAVMYSVKRR